MLNRVSGVSLIADLRRALDPHADPRNVAMIQRRHGYWAELARLHGWDLDLRDAAALGDVRDRLCRIDLPMLPRAGYREVFARAVAAGAARVIDAPEDVDRTLGLDAFSPVLARAGVPTPRTALVPVDDALASAIDSPAAVRRHLTERVYEAIFDAGLDPHAGIYVRGFYSSAKSANPEHYFASNQADLEATTFEVIRRLRVALDVGGLALREHLDLDRIDLDPESRDGIRVPFEVRLTILGGRAIMASYHGPFEALVDDARAALSAALTARSAAIVAAARAVLPALAAADLPESYVADLAFTRAGDAVVLELNPLYAAGYNVPAAHALLVASLGADLAARTGQRTLSPSEVRDTAAALAGARIESSPGVWLLDS
ncbi:Hypothetical protein A7982_11293 [Minicystis rosea]|nr:Hypothetical protein A7982_11293 [Minicystis rosea]